MPTAVAWGQLSIGIVAMAFAACAWFRHRSYSVMSLVHFAFGWLGSNLPFHLAAAAVIGSAALVWSGSLHQPTGIAGVVLVVAAVILLVCCARRVSRVRDIIDRDLSKAFGPRYLAPVSPHRRATMNTTVSWSDWIRPFHLRRPGVQVVRDIAYGDAGVRNLLDIYRPEDRSFDPCPVLIQIHGGAWVMGHKAEQGLPLMYHLAARGWVCVAINYRLGPAARHPSHLTDVKKAIAWVRRHIAEHGGDPRFIALTGGSAGGHLASLAALTAHSAEYEHAFKNDDTSVDAVVSMYGRYDMIDRLSVEFQAAKARKHFARTVMERSYADAPESWRSASPLDQVHADAPPFFIVHGDHDSLIPVEEAREFRRALAAVSKQPVVYAELPGVQHAFDVFRCEATEFAIRAVHCFLERAYVDRRRAMSGCAPPRNETLADVGQPVG